MHICLYIILPSRCIFIAMIRRGELLPGLKGMPGWGKLEVGVGRPMYF